MGRQYTVPWDASARPLAERNAMDISYRFVDYGERFDPAPGTIVLDVGMNTVPGVIDHHHPEAENECTASLIVKYPHLVLDHVRPPTAATGAAEHFPLTFVTHRLPDFDALSSIFLALKLLETGRLDPAMRTLAAYAKMVDSAALPDSLDLAATPYAVLRALFSGSTKSEEDINRQRAEEGGKFMRFLYGRAAEGWDIVENKRLFAGIDRYERAVHKVEGDYSSYLADLDRSRFLRLELPSIDGCRSVAVDGMAVSNPRSFLLKEWTRRDRVQAPLGRGFGFIMSAFGADRIMLGVDRDLRVHLKGLGARLNRKESEKRAAAGRADGPPWYEGNNAFFDYRIVDSPRDGTSLTGEEVLETVLEFGSGRIIDIAEKGR